MFESPLGFRLIYSTKPYPEVQHKSGGGRVYYITRKDCELIVKPKIKDYLGARLIPDESFGQSMNLIPPEILDIKL